MVLGLPRGGVAVAAEVARVLGAPLDVILVRKLGVPVQPELAMGAIGEGGARVINDEVIQYAGISEEQFAAVEAQQQTELRRRAQRYREDRARVSLTGRTAVVVDDGIATGSTARAACLVARAQGAQRVVLAVPVAPGNARAALAADADADEIVCLEMPGEFLAIGEWYEDFSQTSDDEVVAMLRAASVQESGGPAGGPPASATRLVVIGGLPGTGKSTLASRLGDALGAAVLRSDDVRRGLAGLTPGTQDGRGLYSPEMTGNTYRELLGQARKALAAGESVVVDASWHDPAWREAARSLAREASAEFAEFRCHLPAETIAERVTGRSGDSGADSATALTLVRMLAASEIPWPSATGVDTTPPPEEVAARVLQVLGGRHGGPA